MKKPVTGDELDWDQAQSAVERMNVDEGRHRNEGDADACWRRVSCVLLVTGVMGCTLFSEGVPLAFVRRWASESLPPRV